MTQPEFLAWIEFHKLHPFDDYHRFYRPAALIAKATRPAEDVDDFLEWLEPDPALAQYSQADRQIMKAFGMKPPPRKT